MKSILTGSSGFIGKHLAEELGKGTLLVDKKFDFYHPDDIRDTFCVDLSDMHSKTHFHGDVLYHLAATSQIRDETLADMVQNNIGATVGVLDNFDFDKIVFTSTSAVYGDTKVLPTPEDTPLSPISYYGITKAACENLIKKHCIDHGKTFLALRFGNVVGGGGNAHGVIPDFIAKLLVDPDTLQILGDGSQMKSYVHVDDIVQVLESPLTGTYNVSTSDSISVKQVADIVCDEMHAFPRYYYTGGKRGWVGDVSKMGLSIKKLEKAGYSPEMSSEEAVRKAARELIKTVKP